MRVINEHPNHRWSIKTHCSGYGWNQHGKRPCGAELQVEDVDIQKRSYTDISGVSDVSYGFTCPICKCFTELNDKDIPSCIKNTAIPYGESESNNSNTDESNNGFISW